MVSHEKSDLRQGFGLDFLFGDGTVSTFCPCSKISVENIINNLIVSNLESGPGALVLLQP